MAATSPWRGLFSGYNSRVTAQASGKTLIDYTAVFWSTAAPLVGVLIGAMLTRSWDRQKWMNDNRKQEFRELIDALTDAATALMAQQTAYNNGEELEFEHTEAPDKHTQALKVIKTRIFIAGDVKQMDLLDHWTESIKRMRETNGIHCFEITFENVRDEIIARATKAPKTFMSDFDNFISHTFRKRQ
jgi:hypothetical protein